jgi:hypothetical protein
VILTETVPDERWRPEISHCRDTLLYSTKKTLGSWGHETCVKFTKAVHAKNRKTKWLKNQAVEYLCSLSSHVARVRGEGQTESNVHELDTENMRILSLDFQEFSALRRCGARRDGVKPPLVLSPKF